MYLYALWTVHKYFPTPTRQDKPPFAWVCMRQVSDVMNQNSTSHHHRFRAVAPFSVHLKVAGGECNMHMHHQMSTQNPQTILPIFDFLHHAPLQARSTSLYGHQPGIYTRAKKRQAIRFGSHCCKKRNELARNGDRTDGLKDTSVAVRHNSALRHVHTGGESCSPRMGGVWCARESAP